MYFSLNLSSYSSSWRMLLIKLHNIMSSLDGEYKEPDKYRGNNEWPVTLPPRLLRDGFVIQPTKVTCLQC